MYTYNNNDNNNNCISIAPNTSTRKSLSAHRNKRKVMYDDELNGYVLRRVLKLEIVVACLMCRGRLFHK